MIVTIAVGFGFFGDGMMFPNQAAASAVLVVAVHRHGTGRRASGRRRSSAARWHS